MRNYTKNVQFQIKKTNVKTLRELVVNGLFSWVVGVKNKDKDREQCNKMYVFSWNLAQLIVALVGCFVLVHHELVLASFQLAFVLQLWCFALWL